MADNARQFPEKRLEVERTIDVIGDAAITQLKLIAAAAT